MRCDDHLPLAAVRLGIPDELKKSPEAQPCRIQPYDVWLCEICGDLPVPDGFGFRGITIEEYIDWRANMIRASRTP